MKTIEERAKDIVGEICTMDDRYSRDEVLMMLERMAEEQQAIDIERACNWLRNSLPTVYEFYKAMEE